MNSKAILLSSLFTYSLFASHFSHAEKVEEPPRWFEIEVILFKQLGDKKVLNENFPINKPLPAYRKSFELIEKYIQPDISVLKTILPSCDLDNNTETFGFSNQINQPYFVEKSLSELNELSNLSYKDSPSVKNNILGKFDMDNKDTPLLSPQEHAYIAKASQEFSSQKLATYTQYPHFPQQKLCSINKSYFEDILSKSRLETFQYNQVPVDDFSGAIDATGIPLDETSPYLISKESLLLTDVSKQLRGSKKFKPLLHFGWRQIGITRKKATALKVIAGENFERAYQKELDDKSEVLIAQALSIQREQLELDYTTRREAELLTVSDTNSFDTNMANSVDDLVNNTTVDSNEKPDNSTALVSDNNTTQQVSNEQIPVTLSIEQQRINAILSKLSEVDENNIEEIIKQLHNNDLPKALPQTLAEQIVAGDISSMKLAPITSPLQPWALDGFIKIHLDHYLFITANFNVINQSLSKSQTLNDDNEPVEEIKAINFSQNRRVISGEVHYFDHPYIGMLIQIRRFDPTKPADEAVTQSVR